MTGSKTPKQYYNQQGTTTVVCADNFTTGVDEKTGGRYFVCEASDLPPDFRFGAGVSVDVLNLKTGGAVRFYREKDNYSAEPDVELLSTDYNPREAVYQLMRLTIFNS